MGDLDLQIFQGEGVVVVELPFQGEVGVAVELPFLEVEGVAEVGEDLQTLPEVAEGVVGVVEHIHLEGVGEGAEAEGAAQLILETRLHSQTIVFSILRRLT